MIVPSSLPIAPSGRVRSRRPRNRIGRGIPRRSHAPSQS